MLSERLFVDHERHPLRLFVRQKPGEKNSLGLAKFIFPNSENVYLHGTPAEKRVGPVPSRSR